MKPLLILISAPSGAGKTTLCDKLLQDYPELVYSVSCTTRKSRGDEEDGVDYHFVTDEQFDKFEKEHAFLEHALVHGYRYGTLVAPVRDAFAQGLSVLMDIDVAGAAQVRETLEGLPENDPIRSGFVDIFIMPPSMEELRDRLIGRGEDDMSTIERRLANAAGEMDRAGEYSHKIINDQLDIAYKELKAVLEYENAVIGPENREDEDDLMKDPRNADRCHHGAGHKCCHDHADDGVSGHECCGHHHDDENGHHGCCHGGGRNHGHCNHGDCDD